MKPSLRIIAVSVRAMPSARALMLRTEPSFTVSAVPVSVAIAGAVA